VATRWIDEQNGTYAEFMVDNGTIHKRLFDPRRDEVLTQNRELRKGHGARRMDWGQQVAEIPIPDLEMLRTFFGPALFNPQYDKWDRKVAREKFLKSPASDPYRLEDRKRGGGL
jgi:hypothetical protein